MHTRIVLLVLLAALAASCKSLDCGEGTTECRWDVHAGAAIAGAIFIQIFRPTNAPGKTCLL